MNENAPRPEKGFFAGIRSSNLVRSPDRWFGGVSGAVAERTGMDLMLVRGLFIVIALFGIGFIAYGAAWLLLPDARDGKIQAEEVSRGRVEGQFIAAVAFIIVGFWAPFSLGNWNFGSWMLIPNGIGAAIIAIVILVAVSNNNSGTRGSSGTNASSGASAPTHPQTGAAGGVGGTPPAAPNLDYPTEATSAHGYGHVPPPPPVPPTPPVPPRPPVPPKPPVKRAGLALVSAVVGVALIAAGLIAVNYLETPNFWVTPAGVAIVVLGGGIILAGFMGRSSSVLSPLALVTAFISVTASLGWIGTGPLIGEVSWAPSEISKPMTTKSTGIGSIDIDFLDLKRGSDTRTVDANFGIGEATVWIPDDRHVRVVVTLGIGETTADYEPVRNIFVGDNTWEFGQEFSEEPELIVNVRGGIGSIDVIPATPSAVSEAH